MNNFLIALQFLTILPINIKTNLENKNYGEALFYFPLVGVIIGSILAGLAYILNLFLPNSVSISMLMIISIFITGAIHLDGLADTCDGFYGFQSKEKILNIMRDSRIGAMGVIGIVSLLLLKFTILVSMLQVNIFSSLIMMTTFARWAQVYACNTSKYAREEGKGKYFMQYADKKSFIVNTLFVLILFFLLAKFWGIVIFTFSLIPIFLFIKFSNTKIGGMTGDTIGAVNEIAEVSVIFWCLIFLSRI